ncbi:Oidioi.mRNA.OKI2018_I69.chr2.g5751.t1.cds [Oikopleura dioica]|uniref:Oidioi.mRNA.OKI2018_I69.chr2.g5751.t1.cds n=1 Tax=Oikopleura dioica TaxID=34765 RepID=A0ABN7T1T7_OIKDI|nr:Oidioi.mRNA.OKI2018_I69.chr2.g5751.t1.cds [Oikopleura dioica]
MNYHVSIVHGGSFENVEAPLSINATSHQGIIQALEEIAGLKNIKISHRGRTLKPTDRLPPDGARIFVSGESLPAEKMEVEFPTVTPEQMNEAKNIIKTYGSSRNPIRHDFNTLASEMMRSVYKNYPKLARKDPIGAKICVSAGQADGALFIDCLNKELYKKHPLIQHVLMDIAKKTKESSATFARNIGIDPAILPQILAASAPAHLRAQMRAQQQANAAHARALSAKHQYTSPFEAASANITQDMLTQAIASAVSNPLPPPPPNPSNAPSTSSSNPPIPGTENLQNILSHQVQAMNKRIEDGMAQMREMGIMQQTTEEVARAFLMRSGGNVERAVQLIFETMQ